MWFLAAALFLTGCGDRSLEVVSETDEPQYQRGQRLLREGRDSEAMASFMRVIDRRAEAPESHLEVGRIYQQTLNDPISAIYHYRRYLDKKPNAPEAPLVRQMVDTATKDFARQFPAQPFAHEIDRLDLMEVLRDVRAENETLKAELAQTRQRLARYEAVQVRAPQPAARNTGTAPAARPTATTGGRPDSTADQPRTYTVVEGDTLTRISSKVYGTSARWQDIYHANRDQLPSPHALRLGQQLVIP